MRIGIDIDDTITNSTDEVRRYIREYGHLYCENNELANQEEDILRGFLREEIASRFFLDKAHDISNSVAVKENAREVIDKLRSEGNEIVIITARSDNYYGDAQGFCTKFLGEKGIHYDKLITGQAYKDKACQNEQIDLMIDDAVDTCEAVKRRGIKSLVFNSELNKNRVTSCDRVSTWVEVYNYIHNLKK